ncbi:MAG: hypothetical protein MJY89_06690 [Bacteroidales bacterium]|nr:hypothetical protein [Bacteroidales bacterium]
MDIVCELVDGVPIFLGSSPLLGLFKDFSCMDGIGDEHIGMFIPLKGIKEFQQGESVL